MKKVFIYILILFGMSCQDDNNNLFEDLTQKGGFIGFKETPTSSFNLLDLASVNISAELIDLNDNVTNYALSVEHEGVTVENFFTATSFPSDLVITLPMLLDAFNIAESSLTISSTFKFSAVVTTPNGTFTGNTPDFNDDTNEQEGGNTASNLLGTGFKNAFDFGISFFLPPPDKIRGTSFEEGSTGDGTYGRPDGQANDAEGELFNNATDPNIMYTALGTGTDDEIGFRTEFIDTGRGGFSSERMGITAVVDDVGAFIDGVQGFRLQDSDGTMRITFDRVTVPSDIETSGVQIQYYIPNVGNDMEDSDFLNVYVNIEKPGGVIETMELFNMDGEALNDLRNVWNLIDSGFIKDIVAYTLVIEHDTNSNDERIYFDQMLVYKPEG